MIFPGFAYYESELTGQLKTDWSRLALARMAQSVSCGLSPLSRLSHACSHGEGALTGRKCVQDLLRLRLSPGTQTHSLRSIAETSHKASSDLKGRERGSTPSTLAS